MFQVFWLLAARAGERRNPDAALQSQARTPKPQSDAAQWRVRRSQRRTLARLLTDSETSVWRKLVALQPAVLILGLEHPVDFHNQILEVERFGQQLCLRSRTPAL